MYWKLNWWLKGQRGIIGADRYGILCDDDGFDPECFAKIRAVDPAVPVVITGCELGRRKRPGKKSPKQIGYMKAEPEQMVPGCVGCQFWVLGSVFRDVVFPCSSSADGQIASKLAKENKTVYLPNAAKWYNYLKRD
jgi:hypothetical protein